MLEINEYNANLYAFMMKKYPRLMIYETIKDSFEKGIEVSKSHTKPKEQAIVDIFFGAANCNYSEAAHLINRKIKVITPIIWDYTRRIYKEIKKQEGFKNIDPDITPIVQTKLSRGAVNCLVKRFKDIEYNSTINEVREKLLGNYEYFKSQCDSMEDFLHKFIPNLGIKMCKEIMEYLDL